MAGSSISVCLARLAPVLSLVLLSAAASAGDDSLLRLPLGDGRATTDRPPSSRQIASSKTSPATAHAVAQDAVPIFHARPGPWGDLDYFTVFLEASTALLKSTDFNTYETAWKFVGYTEAQVAALFESLKMPTALKTGLLDQKKWHREEKAIVVLPSREVLLEMPTDARAALYQVLARWEENPFHNEPNVIVGHDVRDWLRRAALREEVVTTIEKTVYQRGKNLVFADTPLLLRMVASEEERLKIRKALSRIPTLVVKLRLPANADVSKIAEYWGGYTRSKDPLPFLESISENPAAEVLDIIHLLPAGVRRLLYTYPGRDHGRTGYYPDCHWTSLNFGNYQPLDRLADPTLATAYVLENYTRVADPSYRYGDVLFFMDGQTGNAIHSCVYLADDIVLTKNGRSPTQPWVLMKLDDVVAFYAMYYQPQLACYRRKPE